jgi:CO dehydrogenase nickel-insertion accessory protein CooC1
VDWVVEIVDPTTGSIQMAAEMKEMVDQIRAGTSPATAHLESPELVEVAETIFKNAKIKGVLVVLNRVSGRDVEGYISGILSEKTIEPIGIIPEDLSIALAWLKGTPLELSSTKRDLDQIVGALEKSEKAASVPVG